MATDVCVWLRNGNRGLDTSLSIPRVKTIRSIADDGLGCVLFGNLLGRLFSRGSDVDQRVRSTSRSVLGPLGRAAWAMADPMVTGKFTGCLDRGLGVSSHAVVDPFADRLWVAAHHRRAWVCIRSLIALDGEHGRRISFDASLFHRSAANLFTMDANTSGRRLATGMENDERHPSVS